MRRSERREEKSEMKPSWRVVRIYEGKEVRGGYQSFSAEEFTMGTLYAVTLATLSVGSVQALAAIILPPGESLAVFIAAVMVGFLVGVLMARRRDLDRSASRIIVTRNVTPSRRG